MNGFEHPQKHPPGLYVLFFTEMWERFGFYSMLAMFTLYLKDDKQGFGCITEHPEVQFVSMSEEHGCLDLGDSAYRPQIGEKLTIIPNHVCTCVNMHDQIYYHRKGIVEGAWTVEGRGKVW